MIAAKVLAVLAEIGLTAIAAGSADTLATRVVLYTMAATGLGWLWRNMLRPLAKLLQRLAASVEALEDLPRWRDHTDERLEELEMGSHRSQSALFAILRELGLEDKVRRMYEGKNELADVWAEHDDADRHG